MPPRRRKEASEIALFHFHVDQIKRSEGQSAIAAAAYRAGEKLHSEYYGEDSDYTRKGGVVCSEILLPSHAPAEYADRQTLWNAVEKVEQHPKAQLAYSFDFALQNEFSMEENIALARQFLLDEFVSRGMTVDFAVHQPDREEDGIPNPHVHVMCPIRPLDEHGRWGAKQHRVYELDENGNRIRDEAGNYVFNAVHTTDWGDSETLEHWREEWANRCNAKFAEKGLSVRVDHRSNERRGIDQLPTIHEGPVVRQMEAKGIRTDKGDLNRWIRATNSMIKKAKERAAELTGKLKDLIAKMREPQSPNLAALLGQYYSIRNAGAYSDKAKAGNLKRYSEDFSFLQSKGLFSVEQLHDYVSDLSGKLYDLNAASRKKADRMKELKELLRLADDYTRLKPIYDGIPPKGGFGKKREKYMAEHESEISQYHAVRRKLDNLLPEKKFATKAWKSELDRLADEYAAMGGEISSINADLKKLWRIQSNVDNTLRQQEQSQNLNKNQRRDQDER